MNDDEVEDEQKSRSQLKREFAALRELGAELVTLKRKRLEALPMSEPTFDAVIAGCTMDRSPLQRQLRRIAGLLEYEDVDAIRSALDDPLEPSSATSAAAQWADDLITGDDELLMEFVELFPAADRRQLRTLLLNARREQSAKKTSKAAEQVVQYLDGLGVTSTE